MLPGLKGDLPIVETIKSEVFMKTAIQLFYSTQSVVFYKSVLGKLRWDTNPYLKLTAVCDFFVSKRERNF